jgi:hypothetical protein
MNRVQKVFYLVIFFFFFRGAFCQTNNKIDIVQDFGGRFLGDYVCIKTCDLQQGASTQKYVNSDTVLIVLKKTRMDSIYVLVIENQEFEIKIDTALNIKSARISGRYFGEFIQDDSINFTYCLGHSFNCKLAGKKQLHKLNR